MHYTKEEMEALSREAQSHSPFWPKLHLTPDEYEEYLSTSGNHRGGTEGILALHADPSLRGLELYLYPVRVRSKLLARKAVLRCQGRLLDHPRATTAEAKARALAAASAQLGRAARSAARETGRLDARRAAGDDDDATMCVCGNAPRGVVGADERRRRRTEEDGEERARKRQRKVSNA